MPCFNIIKEVNPKKTFRVASVMGKFDLQSNQIIETFSGEIEPGNDWQIGLIVGKSGSGKTTIAKELFPDAYITNFVYKAETILDDMPAEKSVEEITKTFNAVGFSSPPSWLKPYAVLSNGEKMRCDLARAILSDNDLFVFDEFTSVVDRTVAQIGSFAMQKSIRRTKKKFIAVTCHSDVEDWLLPDWTFDTDTMTFRKNEVLKKNRPELKCEIFKTKFNSGTWNYFKKFHYLNHDHHKSADCFLMTIDGNPVSWISTMNLLHPRLKGIRKGHRFVTIPDYQGAGLGKILLNFVGEYYSEKQLRFRFTTSSPSIIYPLKADTKWKCLSFGKKTSVNRKAMHLNKTLTNDRITTTWEYLPEIGTSKEVAPIFGT